MGIKEAIILSLMKTTKKTSYETPEYILNKYMGFFDPCPRKHKFNGLKIKWKKKNFVNPPYSEKKAWIEKAIEEKKKGNTSIMLLPVDTSTEWFHELILPNAKIKWIRGRLSFNGKTPPFASMICVFEGGT